jgi:hypothetical protein
MTIREFLKQFHIDVDTDCENPEEVLDEALAQARVNSYKTAYNALSEEEKDRWNEEYWKVYH